MSTRELRRAEVLGRVKAETLRLVDAAKMLELSYRQAKRLWQRYREEGAKGLQQSDIPEVLVSRTKRESSHLAVPGPQSAGAVPAASGALSGCAPGSTIPPPTVCEWEDGAVEMHYRGERMDYEDLVERPRAVQVAPRAPVKQVRSKSAQEHPWRQGYEQRMKLQRLNRSQESALVGVSASASP
jgi:hypothetical protein